MALINEMHDPRSGEGVHGAAHGLFVENTMLSKLWTFEFKLDAKTPENLFSISE